MPVTAALDEFDAASRVARGDRMDHRLDVGHRDFLGKARRDLPCVERFVAGEQHRLYRTFAVVDRHVGCCPIWAALRYSGSKAPSCFRSTRPCRASSSAATKLDAIAERRKGPS